MEEITKAIISNRPDVLTTLIDNNNAYEFINETVNATGKNSDRLTITSSTTMSIIHMCALNESTECLEYLLQFPCFTVEAYTPSLLQPLHFAILGEAVECVSTLLYRGADPNFEPLNTRLTPLFLAAHVGSPLIANMLFDYGATLSIPKAGTDSPIYEAIRCGHFECFEVLMNRGLMKNTSFAHQGYSIIMCSIANGLYDAVPILIQQGVSVNTVSPQGNTALSLACRTKEISLIKCIMDAPGFNIGVFGAGGYYAIHWAASTCSPEIVKIVISYGADVKAEGTCHRTAMYSALKFRPRKTPPFFENDIEDQIITLNILYSYGLSAISPAFLLLEYVMDPDLFNERVFRFILSQEPIADQPGLVQELLKYSSEKVLPCVKSLIEQYKTKEKDV